MFVRWLLKRLPKEKVVGRDFNIVWHVLGSLAAILAVSIIATLTDNPISAVTIVGCGVLAFALAILRPDSLVQTELAEDYRSFLPHFPKHMYRDPTQFLRLLFAHLASLLCLVTAPFSLLVRTPPSCETAAQHSVESRRLLLASTHVLRAPPSFA